jgi:hypothetical protein
MHLQDGGVKDKSEHFETSLYCFAQRQSAYCGLFMNVCGYVLPASMCYFEFDAAICSSRRSKHSWQRIDGISHI